jgi:serine/threonine protein kinase
MMFQGFPVGVVCDETGEERWTYFDRALSVPSAGGVRCFVGNDPASGQQLFVKRVETDPEEGILYDPDLIAAAQREIDVCRTVGGAPGLLGFVGSGKTPSGGWCRVFEWADGQLADDATALRAAVDAPLTLAVASLHAAGFVHSDIHPGNILHVQGAWKLADFDGCVPIGAPVVRHPKQARYLLDGVAIGTPATVDQDWYAVTAVLDELDSAR